MMHKLVNGVRVELTLQEAQAFQAEWEANDLAQIEHEAKFGHLEKIAKELPSINEQLDMLWEAMNNGEIPKAKKFYESIKTIKDKHKPKE